MKFGFENRREAGKILAGKLGVYAGRDDVVVLALPRGGVPVAFEVASALGVPLDIFVVRKLGVPGQEELALGAIASGGDFVLNHELVNALGITRPMLERIADRESAELHRREIMYRGSRPRVDIRGKTVIVVDDGLATGATMRVAVEALKKESPSQIIVAVPIGSKDTCAEFAARADALCVCAVTPEPFYGVGVWYQDFSQTSDDEVRELLDKAQKVSADRKAA
jgi:predicted phosphoribosyltransferase